MQIPGRLSSSTLGDVLGALHRARVTGSLELCECGAGAVVPGRRHAIHLSRGLVTRVESPAAVSLLGEILAREGLLDRVGLSALSLHRAAGDARPAGEILIAGGYADVDRVEWALRRQTRERLEVLFALPDAQLSFHAARSTRPAARANVHPLTPKDFLEGKPRRRDGRRQPRAPKADADRRAFSGAGRAGELARARQAAYRILDVEAGAGADEIRRAFRRAAARLHPDRATSASDAERQRRGAEFARLSAAYHLLTG